MTDLRLTLPPETIEELVDLVLQRVLDRLAAQERADSPEYLTTAEYAHRHRTTAGAVLARINRGTLHAIRPPGSRQWLIPAERNDD